MNSEWRTFLEQNGAVYTADKLAFFNEPVADLCSLHKISTRSPLDYLGIIQVSGNDATDFLQGQFSNDIKQVTDSHAQLSGYCSPKGRLLASFVIYMVKDNYFLLLDKTILDATQKRLTMFVMRSDVTLSNVSDEFCVLGLTGTDVADMPDENYSVIAAEHTSIIRLPSPIPRCLRIVPTSQATSIWQTLDNLTPVAANYWQLLSIQAGQPEISVNTADAFVPQMVNLHVVDGVSFKKGCYPGQEIVARTQYLGKLKRRMYRVQVETTETITPGSEIYQSATDDTQSVGKVVSAQIISSNHAEALVVLQIAKADSYSDALHIGEKSGPRLKLTELPYPFPNTSSDTKQA